MRVVTYDIRFGWGLDRRVDLERIARNLRDADIIALQEVERFWRRSAMTDPPGRAPQRGMRLDCCFASAELAGSIRRAWIDQAAEGSDHQPFWVEFAEP